MSTNSTAAEQVHAPDFALAAKIYREEIRPAQSKVGEFAQESSTAFKAIKKQAHIQPQAAKAAFALVDMEDAKRDDYLRSFSGLLKELGIGITADLVDAAEGKVPDTIVPIGSGRRRGAGLATMPTPPADDSDLLGGAADDADAHAEQAAE